MATQMLHTTQPTVAQFFPDGTGYASEVDLSHAPDLPQPPAWRCAVNPQGTIIAILQDLGVTFLRVQRLSRSDRCHIAEKQHCAITSNSAAVSEEKSNHSWSESGEIFAVGMTDCSVVLFKVALSPALHCTVLATLVANQWPKLPGVFRGLHFLAGCSLVIICETGQMLHVDIPELPGPRLASTAQLVGCPKGCAGGVQCSVVSKNDRGEAGLLLHLACKLDASDHGLLSVALSVVARKGGGYRVTTKDIARVRLFSVEEGLASGKGKSSGFGGMLRGMFAKDMTASDRLEMAVAPGGRRAAVVRCGPAETRLYWVSVGGESRSVALPEGALVDVAWWSEDVAVVGTKNGGVYSVNEDLAVVKEAHVEDLISVSRGEHAETRLCCMGCTSGWSEAPAGREVYVRHGKHVLCRSYTFSVIRESSVDAFVKGKIAKGETDVALAVAAERGIDMEAVNKWVWECSAVKDAELWKQYGSLVRDTDWVTDQVVHCVLPTLADMQILVEAASSFLERRDDLESFLEKWRTYVSIVGSAEYSPSSFSAFKATNSLELAKRYAEKGQVDAVRVMLRRHGNEPGFVLTEHILHLLDCFPDSLSPAAYKDLLPYSTFQSGSTGGPYLVLTSDGDAQPFASRHTDDSSGLRFVQLCEWFISRAHAFDSHSGMLFHAQQLTALALHRLDATGMPAESEEEECYLRLVQLHDDAWMLTTLVYQQQLNTLMSLDEWQAMDLKERVRLLSHEITPATAVNALVERLVPAYCKLPTNSLLTLSWLKALRAFLVSLCRDEAGEGITICAALIEQSRPIKQTEGGVPRERRVIPSTQVLIETALACCYANVRVDDEALEAMERIFESLPVRLPELEKRLPALARLQDRVELLEIHLRADMVLAKYNSAVPLSYFLEAKRSQDEAELEEMQVVDVEQDPQRTEVMSHALMQRRDSRMGDPEMEPDSGKSLLLRLFRSAAKGSINGKAVDDALLVRSLVFPYIQEQYVYVRGLLALLRGLAFDEAHELLQRESLTDCLRREEIEDAVCAVFQELFNSAADASQMEVVLARQTLDVLPFTPSQRVQSERSLLSAVELLHSELAAPMVPLQVKKLLAEDPMTVLDELFKLNPHAFRPPSGSGIPAVGATVLRLAGHLGLRSHEEKLAVNARLVRACVAVGDAPAALAVAHRMDALTQPLPEACFRAFVSIAKSTEFDAPTRRSFCLRCIDTCAAENMEEALEVFQELPRETSAPELMRLVKEPVPEVDILAALDDDAQAVSCSMRLMGSLPSVAVMLLGHVLRAHASDDGFITRTDAEIKEAQMEWDSSESMAERSRTLRLYAYASALFEDFAVMNMPIVEVCSRVQTEANKGDSSLADMALEAARAAQLSAERGGLDELLGDRADSEQFQNDSGFRERTLRTAAVALFEQGALEKEARVQTLWKTADGCQVDLFEIAAEWVEAQVVGGANAKTVADNATKRGKALHVALRTQADTWLSIFCPRIWAALPGKRKDLLFLACNLAVAFLKFGSSPGLEKAVLVKTREALKRLHALAPQLDAKKVLSNPFTQKFPTGEEAVKEVIGSATEENVLSMTSLLSNRAAAIAPKVDEAVVLAQFIQRRLVSSTPPAYSTFKKLLPKLGKADVVQICRHVALDSGHSALSPDTAQQVLKDGVRLAGEVLTPVLALLNARLVAMESGETQLARALSEAGEERDEVKATLVEYILAEGSSPTTVLRVIEAFAGGQEKDSGTYHVDVVYMAAFERCFRELSPALDRLFSVHLPTLHGEKVKSYVAGLCSELTGQHQAKAHALELLEASGSEIDSSLVTFHRAMCLVTSSWQNPELHSQPFAITNRSQAQTDLFDRLEQALGSVEQHDAFFELLRLLDDSADAPISFDLQARRFSTSLVSAILDSNNATDAALESIHEAKSRLHQRWHSLLVGFPPSALVSSKIVDRLPSNALTEEESTEVVNHFAFHSKTLALEFGFTSPFFSVQRITRGIAVELAKSCQFPQHLAIAVQSCCPPSFLLKQGIPFPELQTFDEAAAFTWSSLYVEAALVCEGHILAAGRVALEQRHIAPRLWSAFSPIACLDYDLKHHVSVVAGGNMRDGWERAGDIVDRALEILSDATSTKRVVSSPTLSSSSRRTERAQVNGHDLKKDEAGWESGSELEVSSKGSEAVDAVTGGFDERVDEGTGSQAEGEGVDRLTGDGAWDEESDLELSSHSDDAQIEAEENVEESAVLHPKQTAWDSEIVISDDDVGGQVTLETSMREEITKPPPAVVNVDDGWVSENDIDVDTDPSDEEMLVDRKATAVQRDVPSSEGIQSGEGDSEGTFVAQGALGSDLQQGSRVALEVTARSTGDDAVPSVLSADPPVEDVSSSLLAGSGALEHVEQHTEIAPSKSLPGSALKDARQVKEASAGQPLKEEREGRVGDAALEPTALEEDMMADAVTSAVSADAATMALNVAYVDAVTSAVSADAATMALNVAYVDAETEAKVKGDVGGSTGWESDMSLDIDDESVGSPHEAPASDAVNDVAIEPSSIAATLDEELEAVQQTESVVVTEVYVSAENVTGPEEISTLPIERNAVASNPGQEAMIDHGDALFTSSIQATSGALDHEVDEEINSSDTVDSSSKALNAEEAEDFSGGDGGFVEESPETAGNIAHTVLPRAQEPAEDADSSTDATQEVIGDHSVMPAVLSTEPSHVFETSGERNTDTEETIEPLIGISSDDEVAVGVDQRREVPKSEVEAEACLGTESAQTKTTSSVLGAEESSLAASLGSDLGHASSVAAVCGEDHEVDSTLGDTARDTFGTIEILDVVEPGPSAREENAAPTSPTSTTEAIGSLPQAPVQEGLNRSSEADHDKHESKDLATAIVTESVDPTVATMMNSSAEDILAALSSAQEMHAAQLESRETLQESSEAGTSTQQETVLKQGSAIQGMLNSFELQAYDDVLC